MTVAPLLCALLVASHAPAGGLASGHAGTRVRGHDQALEAASGPPRASSPRTRWASLCTYGETASDRANQYNGRVYDAGTGFHDYGARLYWPEIGRFVSADSYLGDPANPASLNRYSYVHNNPYKYVDPTGTTVEVVGGTQFKTKTQAQIEALQKTPTGAKIYKQLKNSKHVFKIQENKGSSHASPDDAVAAQNGKGTGGTIEHDPDWNPKVPTPVGEKPTPPAIVLGHEMKHAADYDNGTLDRSVNPDTGVRRSEEEAVKVENKIRTESGVPERSRY